MFGQRTTLPPPGSKGHCFPVEKEGNVQMTRASLGTGRPRGKRFSVHLSVLVCSRDPAQGLEHAEYTLDH